MRRRIASFPACTLLALLSCALPSCSEKAEQSAQKAQDDCSRYPSGYANIRLDISKQAKASSEGLKDAISFVQKCYPSHPYESPDLILVYEDTIKGLKTGERFLVFKLLGLTHTRLLFLVSADGKIRESYLTSFPYQGLPE